MSGEVTWKFRGKIKRLKTIKMQYNYINIYFCL